MNLEWRESVIQNMSDITHVMHSNDAVFEDMTQKLETWLSHSVIKDTTLECHDSFKMTQSLETWVLSDTTQSLRMSVTRLMHSKRLSPSSHDSDIKATTIGWHDSVIHDDWAMTQSLETWVWLDHSAMNNVTLEWHDWCIKMTQSLETWLYH